MVATHTRTHTHTHTHTYTPTHTHKQATTLWPNGTLQPLTKILQQRYLSHESPKSHFICIHESCHPYYEGPTTRGLLRFTGLFRRIYSLFLGSFAKETYHFKEPTNGSHPIPTGTLQPFTRQSCKKGMCTYNQHTH